VARKTISCVYGLVGINRGLLTCHRILHGFRRSGRVMEWVIGGFQHQDWEDKQ
jgi:hypothetical protein